MRLREKTPPSEALATQARAALRALAPLLRDHPATVNIRPEGKPDEATVTVPLEAFELFVDLLAEMAKGNAVTLLPIHAEVTTQEAAEMLNVSRPFLIKLLEEKRLPFRMVGTHRRIRLTDLLEYKKADDERRRKAIDELAAEGENLGFDY